MTSKRHDDDNDVDRDEAVPKTPKKLVKRRIVKVKSE
jgi:hypothetical protein